MSELYSQPGEKGTDTNQVSELYELCKKVYELTSWKDTYSRLDDGNHTIRNEGNEVLLGSKQVPLYTSDYLLEKLPATIENTDYHNGGIDRKKRIALNLRKWDRFKNGGIVYFAEYHEMYYSPLFSKEADTPLLALLRLTIALSEAGELQ